MRLCEGSRLICKRLGVRLTQGGRASGPAACLTHGREGVRGTRLTSRPEDAVNTSRLTVLRLAVSAPGSRGVRAAGSRVEAGVGPGVVASPPRRLIGYLKGFRTAPHHARSLRHPPQAVRGARARGSRVQRVL